MTALIDGIEVPETCFDCKFFNYDSGTAKHYCAATETWLEYEPACKTRSADCPMRRDLHCRDCCYFNNKFLWDRKSFCMNEKMRSHPDLALIVSEDFKCGYAEPRTNDD